MSTPPRPRLTAHSLTQLASNPHFQGILLRLHLCEVHARRARARCATAATENCPVRIAEDKYRQIENELVAFALPHLGVQSEPGCLRSDTRFELVHILLGMGCAASIPGND